MDSIDLKNTIYAGQKDLNSLIESRPGERKDWFSRALRLDYLKDESLSLIKEQIDAKERGQYRIESEINGIKNMMNEKELIDNQDALDRYTTIISDLRASIEQLHDRLNHLKMREKSYSSKKMFFNQSHVGMGPNVPNTTNFLLVNWCWDPPLASFTN
jgi:DNA repair exonuclease SbcCD ATPase subunit